MKQAPDQKRIEQSYDSTPDPVCTVCLKPDYNLPLCTVCNELVCEDCRVLCEECDEMICKECAVPTICNDYFLCKAHAAVSAL